MKGSDVKHPKRLPRPSTPVSVLGAVAPAGAHAGCAKGEGRPGGAALEAQSGASTPGAVAAGVVTAGAAGGATVIAIDGSSTVFPITEAVAEEFRAKSPARV